MKEIKQKPDKQQEKFYDSGLHPLMSAFFRTISLAIISF